MNETRKCVVIKKINEFTLIPILLGNLAEIF